MNGIHEVIFVETADLVDHNVACILNLFAGRVSSGKTGNKSIYCVFDVFRGVSRLMHQSKTVANDQDILLKIGVYFG